MIYIIDTYAWVEYFIGSKKGETLKKLFLDEENVFLTVECCLAEVNSWCIKNNQDFDTFLKLIKSNSRILIVTERNWIDSAEERFKQRKSQKDFGLIDSVILVKQRDYNSKIISGDSHFKKLNNVIFLE